MPYIRQWRNEGGIEVFKPPLKFRRPTKIVPNSTRLWKLLKHAEFRKSTHQGVRKKGGKIVKLPSVRNCFTLAITNKLVFIMNSLKVPIIKIILLCEMKFLVPNYSCLQNPWLGGYRPQIPVLSVLNLICWTPPRTKFLGTPLISVLNYTYVTPDVRWLPKATILNSRCLHNYPTVYKHITLIKIWTYFPQHLFRYISGLQVHGATVDNTTHNYVSVMLWVITTGN